MNNKKDKIVIATAKGGQVRIVSAITTNVVDEGIKRHNCAPTASAALGRLLTAGVLMGAMIKSKEEVLTIKMAGGGPANGVLVTAYEGGKVKGYIGNPDIDLPANEKGKLDVGGAIGTNGNLIVIRDMGLKDPYIGQVPLYTGEVGDDLAYYYTVSEQTPSAVGLGVLVDTDLSVKAAGGFIIQMMPEAEDFIADIITYRLEEVPSITDLIQKGMSMEEILQFIFEDMDLKIIGEGAPEYYCDCSREKVEKALISIGKKDLAQIYAEGKPEKLVCHFCNESYEFTQEDIGNILDKI
jgi:molecular chaperone Hsp33